MGRTPQLSLNESEKHDILLFIKHHEQTGSALSIHQVETAILLMKLEKQGKLEENASPESVEPQLERLRPQCYSLWKHFKQWAERQDGKDSLAVSKLRTKTAAAVASCTPPVVAKAFDDLETILEDLGFTSNGILLPDAAARVCCADEKGFSARADTVLKGVTTRGSRSTAAGVQSATSFDHAPQQFKVKLFSQISLTCRHI